MKLKLFLVATLILLQASICRRRAATKCFAAFVPTGASRT